MINLQVNIDEKEKSYPIIINNNDISTIKEKINNYTRGTKILVVISQKVDKLYGKTLGFCNSEKIILKDGEQEKNFKNFQKILKKAFEMGLTRKDTIIAVGGGVVGDIAGFAASTYMRGIDFIQVPTTLLSAVDSSVGGKVAINSDYGKNLIGAFYQPKTVFINVNFLKTLDEKQFKSGLGEVLKYGFIEKSCIPDVEPHLINFLIENKDKILAKELLTLKELIKLCLQLKIEVVQKDEKEGGLRKILNYGHTYGHVVENLTGYKKYTHGECVIEGIRFALALATKLNLVDKEYKFLSEDLIEKFDYKPLKSFDINKTIYVMTTDKKATDEYITFILPSQYAQVFEYKISKEELKKLITS